MIANKVFVTGCFDMINSGQIAFLKKASKFGELYVGIESDLTFKELRGHSPVYNENERLFIVNSIKYVKSAFLNSGHGIMSFKKNIISLKPNIFVVNEDLYSHEIKGFCDELDIDLKIINWKPCMGLPSCNSTANCTTKKMQSSLQNRFGSYMD